jgi:hypothetical protein
LLQEFREEKHEGSVVSTQTTETLCVTDDQLWCTIREELEHIGIIAVAFDANKDFNFEWFTKVIATGALGSFNHPTAKPCEDLLHKQLKGI